jgi:hypothetical protein
VPAALDLYGEFGPQQQHSRRQQHPSLEAGLSFESKNVYDKWRWTFSGECSQLFQNCAELF